MSTHLAISFFASLFAVLDPLGNLPIFVSLTNTMRPPVRRGVALLLSAFIAATLLAFLFVGHAILSFFGISVAAFQISGGIVLFLMGLQMVGGASHDARATARAQTFANAYQEAQARFSDIVVPIGIPLFVGPGTMSAVILFAAHAESSPDPTFTLAIFAAIVVVCSLLSFVILLASDPIARALGEGGLAVSTRIMGLILCAMSVQFILAGLARAMPTIFDATALTPG